MDELDYSIGRRLALVLYLWFHLLLLEVLLEVLCRIMYGWILFWWLMPVRWGHFAGSSIYS